MRSVHDELAGKVRATPEGDYSRQAPVRFGDAAEPYPTGAADILGWMTEHYRDHAGQIADLLAAWKRETA